MRRKFGGCSAEDVRNWGQSVDQVAKNRQANAKSQHLEPNQIVFMSRCISSAPLIDCSSTSLLSASHPLFPPSYVICPRRILPLRSPSRKKFQSARALTSPSFPPACPRHPSFLPLPPAPWPPLPGNSSACPSVPFLPVLFATFELPACWRSCAELW